MKFYGKIPDILVLITGHFGLFKTPTLRLGEASRTQTQSQTRQLNISKIDFKSVRKTIQLLNYVLQNLTIDGENVYYDYKPPFDIFAKGLNRKKILPRLGSNQQPTG